MGWSTTLYACDQVSNHNVHHIYPGYRDRKPFELKQRSFSTNYVAVTDDESVEIVAEPKKMAKVNEGKRSYAVLDKNQKDATKHVKVMHEEIKQATNSKQVHRV